MTNASEPQAPETAPRALPDTLRDIPYMGVIYVVAEAMKLGFYNGHPDWCNLGQGQPEVGEMEGAPARLNRIELQPGDHAYGHINGTDAMCKAVADHYNRLYRKGQASQYGPENVAVAAGGRLILTRIFAALGSIRLGYQTPDYTAYEDMLDAQRHRVEPVHMPTSASEGFVIPPERFEQSVMEKELGGFLFSNPCNPTGQVVQGEDLASYVDTCRRHGCALISDEFYSHFLYTPEGQPGTAPVSAAAYVGDVNEDPVLVVDGLTKNYRYPGWRVGWAVGPAAWIDTLGRAASAIDGGPSQPIQRAALTVLEPARADQETDALRIEFARKRTLMVEGLSALGIRCSETHSPESGMGTFYVWASLEGLPAPFNDADVFFRRALERRVMTVPGRFFDVNPGQERTGRSPYHAWMRFSFGPPYANVEMGLTRLAEMLAGK